MALSVSVRKTPIISFGWIYTESFMSHVLIVQ